MHSLDEFDRKILKLLQQNNKITAEELGNRVHLSTSAVQRRLARLRREKIIEADVSVISPSAVGWGISCVVDVSLHLGSSEVIDSYKELLSSCEEVVQCYYVTGSFDFVVIVHTKDMKHYERFSKQYFMDYPAVKQFYTHVVIDKVKSGYGIAV
jgi:Lrp/AsnC family transcriptional regulator, leucine-responsive regulatory protein